MEIASYMKKIFSLYLSIYLKIRALPTRVCPCADAFLRVQIGQRAGDGATKLLPTVISAPTD